MATRLELSDELHKLLGSKNVYFQPPESLKMKYPAFIYDYGKPVIDRADNTVYNVTNQYSLMYVSPKLDMDFVISVVKHFRMCSLDRAPYAVDGLYHAVFTLYY